MTVLLLSIIQTLVFAAGNERKPVKVTVGHFPNITHAQGVIAQGNHWFEERLAPDVLVEWKIFNAGPSAIEAIFAGGLDIAYIGPSPAVNGYVKSGGEEIRVVAGAASGGAALVVRADAPIRSVQDFHGRKIASPQLGNTQDVSLRAWLARQGLKLKDLGGDVQVIPISNADQQTLFLKKEIDAAWTIEPWVSTLVQKAGGRIFLEESSLWANGEYATTLLVVRKKFRDEHPDVMKKFVEAHIELTDWITRDPGEAKKILARELERETQRAFPPDILESAWSRIRFTADPMIASVTRQAGAAREAGFLKKDPDLGGLFDLEFLKKGDIRS